jgi:molybdate transport system substrate-binding protein
VPTAGRDHNRPEQEETMRAIVHKISLCALALTLSAGVASAAEIRLIAVGGAKVALDKIIADYTKETGNQVNFTSSSPPMVAQKIVSEAYDVVVQSAPAMDDAVKAGALKAETRAPVARGGIGVAVRKVGTVPDISTPDAFKKTLMGAKTIAVTDPAMPNASGILTQRIFTDAGIMDSIKDKVKVIGLDPGQQAISKGEADIGLFNISEVRDYVTYVGPVPAPLQKYTSYEAAVTAKAAAPEAASAFVKMLASAGSADRWKQGGLEPQAGK